MKKIKGAKIKRVGAVFKSDLLLNQCKCGEIVRQSMLYNEDKSMFAAIGFCVCGNVFTARPLQKI